MSGYEEPLEGLVKVSVRAVHGGKIVCSKEALVKAIEDAVQTTLELIPSLDKYKVNALIGKAPLVEVNIEATGGSYPTNVTIQ